MHNNETTAQSKILRTLWHGRPYYSLDAYCKNTFGRKLYKTAIDAGFTCPNRDGTLDTRGCIFCSAGGSGDFAVKAEDLFSNPGKLFLGKTFPNPENNFPETIAYFQAFTNTYAPVDRLEALYRSALDNPEVAGISIATRPDCLPSDVLTLLQQLKREYGAPTNGKSAKFIWIELGLQTIHEKTAAYIRRGYPLSVFDACVNSLQSLGIPVIVHVILGLPKETKAHCLETIQYLNTKHIFGIKLQLLHVLRGTDLYNDYKAGLFHILTKEEYMSLLIDCIGHLDKEIVIHRLTGDGPKNLLEAPLWSCNKRDVLNTIHHEMKVRNIYQGIYLPAAREKRGEYHAGTTDAV